MKNSFKLVLISTSITSISGLILLFIVSLLNIEAIESKTIIMGFIMSFIFGAMIVGTIAMEIDIRMRYKNR